MTKNTARCTWTLTILAVATLGGAAGAQSFVINTADIPSGSPGNNSSSQSVDFGDVDLDGDWDAVFADGGGLIQDQNRIWINQGPGAGLGSFVDETAVRFPVVNDHSRDLEFVDFDGDSDLDLYVTNTFTNVAQPDRWWRNVGVGTGTYVDETASRWVGLGGVGSSVAADQVLETGGFIDSTSDCEFADLDNDGDMDLFHSSYGGFFFGQTPSRVFLNDGLGYFTEFNPSGIQLVVPSILDGNPGLWCEGTQQADTLDSSGVACDIASSARDIDLGDIDGDFDIDVLHGAMSEVPRMFRNRLVENGGVLSFRDVTGAVFPAGYSSDGDGHNEQEMGDLDGDGDLDILGLGWTAGFTFQVATLSNTGDGVFEDLTTGPAAIIGFGDGDLFDYDNDGDLDAYVGTLVLRDRVLRNDNDGGTSFNLTQVVALESNNSAVGVQSCDVDGDGDYDLFIGNEVNEPNYYLQNVDGGTDVHAPYIPKLEQAPDRLNGSVPTVIRAQVYDNAPYHITWYNTTELIYSVNGGPLNSVPMKSSGGQIFRGEIPGVEVGTIYYYVTSSDEYGNVGNSTTKQYVADPAPAEPGVAFCFGDGTGTPCPCNNEGAPFEGCLNSTGAGAAITGTGSASVGARDLVLSATHLVPGQPGLFFQGDNALNSGNGNSFGDGLHCAGLNIVRLQVVFASPLGDASTNIDIGSVGAVSIGDTKYYQLWYRDPVSGPCGTGYNQSNGYEVVWGL